MSPPHSSRERSCISLTPTPDLGRGLMVLLTADASSLESSLFVSLDPLAGLPGGPRTGLRRDRRSCCFSGLGAGMARSGLCRAALPQTPTSEGNYQHRELEYEAAGKEYQCSKGVGKDSILTPVRSWDS